MSKTNYSKFVSLSKRLIDKNGTKVTVLLENSSGTSWKSSDEPSIQYEVDAIFIPPVNGIYFQGTRFSEHTLNENDLSGTKTACLVAPISDEEGNNIDLTDVTAVIRDNVKYRVTFCDTLNPADKVIFYAYGLGR